jgi:cytochrome c-type biogenesis protein
MQFGEALLAWWGPALAFAAGVVSCASPCVLPLLPGYLAFVSGGTSEERRPMVPLLLFVLGFAIVFTALGAFTRTFVPLLRSEAGQRIAGGVVVAFGTLMLLEAFRVGVPGLFADRRPFLTRVRPGTAGALPLGMAFAAGWTPCIGPVLAGILTLAAAQGGGVRGAVLMFSYSLGLGLPFVLLGLGARRFLSVLQAVKRNYHWFAGVGGALMVAIGVLLVANLWQVFLVRIGLLRLIRGFTPPI